MTMHLPHRLGLSLFLQGDPKCSLGVTQPGSHAICVEKYCTRSALDKMREHDGLYYQVELRPKADLALHVDWVSSSER